MIAVSLTFNEPKESGAVVSLPGTGRPLRSAERMG
jgi:hypothetical protein